MRNGQTFNHKSLGDNQDRYIQERWYIKSGGGCGDQLCDLILVDLWLVIQHIYPAGDKWSAYSAALQKSLHRQFQTMCNAVDIFTVNIIHVILQVIYQNPVQ